ncbi:MAG: DUF3379 family protein [Betaproteobacteria bacterium]
MNALPTAHEVKRMLLADPRLSTPELEAAIAGDEALQQFRRQLLRNHDGLARAFAEVAPPPGLADRVILRVRYRRRSTWAAGIAAGVVAVSLSLFMLRHDGPPAIAVAMLDHVVEESGEWADDGEVSAATTVASLQRVGVPFHDLGYRIRHLSECVVNGRTGRHLVMNTPEGLVSFLIMPQRAGEVSRRLELDRGPMQAVLLPASEVAIGVFADRGVNKAGMEAMTRRMFMSKVDEA